MLRLNYNLGGILIGFFMYSSSFAATDANINAYLMTAMREYKVPVVGYAIIDNYKIVEASTLSIDPNLKVSKHSLFQAASLSKSVASVGVLKLVSQGKLSIDEPIVNYMSTWKIPPSDYGQSVSLRQILSMTSGLSYEAFSSNVPFYTQREALPTLLEILTGTHPAKNQEIKLYFQPGSRYQYSGAGFQVMQQLIEDITHKSFSEFAKSLVLNRSKMDHSIFQYPLTKEWKPYAVSGFGADGKIREGGWDNIASAASGGMWTTPLDMAKFVIQLSNAYLGKNDSFLPKKLAVEMLRRQKNSSFGLGVVVDGQKESLNFRKNGGNTGYQDEFVMFPIAGKGVVIMTNSANGISVINYIVPIIANKYCWPSYYPYFDEFVQIPELSPARKENKNTIMKKKEENPIYRRL